MDYQVYAYLQLGQDAKAKALIDEMAAVSGLTESYMPGPYALAISPVRYVVERGDWKAAADLQVRLNPLPQVQAITYTARALGAARGPLTMKHVGICTQDGPEEKTGALRFLLSASRLNATLSVAGVDCTYSGQLFDSYAGTMNCPGRQGVPLKLWVK